MTGGEVGAGRAAGIDQKERIVECAVERAAHGRDLRRCPGPVLHRKDRADRAEAVGASITSTSSPARMASPAQSRCAGPPPTTSTRSPGVRMLAIAASHAVCVRPGITRICAVSTVRGAGIPGLAGVWPVRIGGSSIRGVEGPCLRMGRFQNPSGSCCECEDLHAIESVNL